MAGVWPSLSSPRDSYKIRDEQPAGEAEIVLALI